MIAVSAELAATVLINAVIVGIAWGSMRRDVSGTRRDIHDIKKALGLEPVNGKIETASVPRSECRLMEGGIKGRVEGCEERVGDCEHRLMAVEARGQAI